MERRHSEVVHALGERTKELRFLYEVTNAVRSQPSLSELLREIVRKAPAAWQHPAITSARIRLDGESFESSGFLESAWRLAAEIRTGERVRGGIEIFYAEERPADAEGPFLAEERHLLDAVAEIVGEALERREAEEELRQHRESLEDLVEVRTRALKLARHALDRAGEAAFWIDLTGNLFDVNEQACRLLGYTREELLRLSVVDLVESFSPELVEQRYRSIMETGASGTAERIVFKKGGIRLPVEIVTSISEFHGKRFALSLVRDITERKRAAAELEAARTAAEGANRAKSAFLAHMSHEIRTPMNAVLGFAQLLQRDATLKPAQRGHVDTILRSGEHLLDIINDVLEMSKIEAGQVPILPVDFDIRMLISDLEAMFRERARSKGLAFDVEVLAGGLVYAHGDQGKIRQIVVNLLGNAVKFTRSGKVVLRVRSTPRDEGRFELRFEIEDSGVGISAEEVQLLFREFQQASAGRAASGSGLGLAISRRYARLMGGDVTVSSELGKGSTFTASVEVEPGGAERIRPRRTARRIVRLAGGTAPPRVLVVDDHEESRAFLASLFADVGYRVVEAENGREALEVIERQVPNAVLLDINMPEMGGVDVLQRLGERSDRRRIVVVTVSASVLDEAERSAVLLRTDAFVSKPVDAMELLEIVGSKLGVQYVVETDDREQHATLPADALARETLDEAAKKMLPEIRQAAKTANARRLRALLDPIEPRSPVLVAELKRLLDSYDYDAVLALLDDTTKGET